MKNRKVLYCKRLNDSSISIPVHLKSYEKSIRKLFIATCKKHDLKNIHVDLFFYLDSSRKAASVTLSNFDIYHINFNVIWNDTIENFVKNWEHEFCHIAQLHQKRLIYKKSLAIWNNKKVYTVKQRQKQYFNLPWEKEARKEEKNYKQSMKLVQSQRMIDKFGIFALKKFIKNNKIKVVKNKIIFKKKDLI
jgi:hypothetical protein